MQKQSSFGKAFEDFRGGQEEKVEMGRRVSENVHICAVINRGFPPKIAGTRSHWAYYGQYRTSDSIPHSASNGISPSASRPFSAVSSITHAAPNA